MAETRPTKSQWQAIHELDKHLSVSAGAGAGKTWVLTERYTTMLAGHPLVLPPVEEEASAADMASRPHQPHQIVAITFTKEAAGEMKARIRERLTRWKQEAASTEEKRKIARLKEEVEQASITTIHGFCSELLREYPLEAGVDPHFQILTESDSRLWLEEAIRDVLDEGLHRGDHAAIRLVNEYGYDPLVRNLFFFYLGVREQTEDFSAMEQETLQQLDAIKNELASTVQQLIDHLQRIVSTDLQGLDTAKGAAKKALELQAKWPHYAKLLTEWQASHFAYSDELPAMFADLVAGWPGNPGKAFPDVKPMKERVAQCAPLLVPDALVQTTRDVCQVLAALHEAFAARKEQERVLDFTDLQNRAVRLLEHPAVRQAQAERLRFLMVDEFQDTNPIQKRMLDALASDNDQLRLFVVGDAKQSIYRFRGADLEVFLETQQQVKQQQGEHVTLAHNFRTQSPIIEFVNRFFGELMRVEEDGPGFATPYEPMVATRPPLLEQPIVELLHYHSQGTSEQDRLREARAVAKRIRQMVGHEALIPDGEGMRTVEYRDITLLFSSMTHVDLYEFALQELGIPYYIIGSRLFFHRQEVKDVALLLQAIVDEHDLIALIGALRSPLFGVSDEALFWLQREGLLADDFRETEHWARVAADDQEKLRRARRLFTQWREAKSFQSAADLLSGILEQTGFEQALLLTFGGSQKVGNVRKLVELAEQQPTERSGVLPFLQDLQWRIENAVKEEDAQVESDKSNVVKIMTVHKSKGLEFPVVILPEMARTFYKSSEKFLYAKGYGLAVAPGESEEWKGLGLMPRLEALEDSKSLEEERRKLYVAMTRARDYLLLVGTRTEPKSQKAPLTIHAKSWFDWIIAVLGEGKLDNLACQIETAWPEVKFASEVELELPESEQEPTAKRDWRAILAQSEIATTGVHQDMREVGLLAENEIAATDGNGDMLANLILAENQGGTAVQGDGSERTEQIREHFPLLAPLVPPELASAGVLISVSALMTYLTCPRQYFYRYQWKLPERAHMRASADESPDALAALEEHETAVPSDAYERDEWELEATVRGTLVHRVLEWLEDPAEQAELIERALAERGLAAEAVEAAKPVLQKEIATYLQSDLFRQVQAAAERQSELKFRLRIGRHNITGIIDKVIRLNDGQARVIDYKTNRISKHNLPQTVAYYTPQLQLYTLVVERLLQWPVERSTLYFTAVDREENVPIASSELAQFEVQVEAALDHIATHQAEADYPQAEDLHPCRHCGYLMLCKGVESFGH